ncbi:TetR/AcrR family transcriptional regulator [Streptomyces sp. MAR4 CNX-425]|uniref:TetR/AcrR family transcriptional regulator n=1 Tax=Streptomyces sp. MAR4 CNX-425 TaxID=3406343 RepID=UPI003B5010E2
MTGSGTSGELPPNGRSALRVDAQRNLEHVLRAAREVFGELGYGAPMEDVARRARVGVGTVYRRFPSKEVLVKRIAEAETARLTEQARAALQQEDEPWAALARFLRASVDSGAGRLLPPQVLGVTAHPPEAGEEEPRVPQQRPSPDGTAAQVGAPTQGGPQATALGGPGSAGVAAGAPDGLGADAASVGGTDAAALLDVVGQLVARARDAGSLRADVSVSDVLLVIATAAPSLPDPAQQAVASARLLDILLDGLRPHAEG